MRRRVIPEINTGSIADIAFLLLLFFLVTTTLEAEMGISRKLPPLPDKPIIETKDIHQRNVLEVLVNGNDELMVEGEQLPLSELRQTAKKFIIGDPSWQDANMPEGEIIEIPLLGEIMVSKQIISLQSDRATSYEMYIKVQNELVGAYNEVRNAYTKKTFGLSMEELKNASLNSQTARLQLKAVKSVYPQRISEAEQNRLEE